MAQAGIPVGTRADFFNRRNPQPAQSCAAPSRKSMTAMPVASRGSFPLAIESKLAIPASTTATEPMKYSIPTDLMDASCLRWSFRICSAAGLAVPPSFSRPSTSGLHPVQ